MTAYLDALKKAQTKMERVTTTLTAAMEAVNVGDQVMLAMDIREAAHAAFAAGLHLSNAAGLVLGLPEMEMPDGVD